MELHNTLYILKKDENMITCNDCNLDFNSERSLSNHLRGGCRTLRKYERVCVCGKLLVYESPAKYKEAIEKDRKCIKCCERMKNHSEETKNKISKKLKSLYESGDIVPNMSGAHSEESRKKMSESRKGKILSNEHKIKIGIGVKESEDFQKHVRDPERNHKISERMKNRIISQETRRKMSKSRADISGDKNPSKRPEVREKLRLNLLERIKDEIEKYGGKMTPFFNETGCKFFDKIMSEQNCHIQHALNGGEFYIKELGYFLDGYDIENNIAYEWDEKHHFDVEGNLLEKDIVRQKKIEKFLNCKFIRFKADDHL